MEMARRPALSLMSGEENAGYVVCFGVEHVALALSAPAISRELIKNDLMRSNMAR